MLKLLLLSLALVSSCSENTPSSHSEVIPAPVSASEAFLQEGYIGLNQFTSLIQFEEILKTKALEPHLNPAFAAQAHKPREVIYLGAYKENQLHTFPENHLLLVFPLELLSRNDYTLSAEVNHENFSTKEKFKPENIQEFLTKMHGKEKMLELTFENPIPVDQLAKIIVWKKDEAQVDELLKKYNLMNVPVVGQ
jgi:hypothetical protein